MRHGQPGVRFAAVCECGKRGYLNRRQARNAARVNHPNECMRAYECPDSTYWHYGHKPLVVRRGVAQFDDYRRPSRQRWDDPKAVIDRIHAASGKRD